MLGPYGKLWILVFSFLVFMARVLRAWAIKGRKKTWSITCRTDRANEANKRYVCRYESDVYYVKDTKMHFLLNFTTYNFAVCPFSKIPLMLIFKVAFMILFVLRFAFLFDICYTNLSFTSGIILRNFFVFNKTFFGIATQIIDSC